MEEASVAYRVTDLSSWMWQGLDRDVVFRDGGRTVAVEKVLQVGNEGDVRSE